MIHYLRTKNNRTIIECEVTHNDLHSYIDVEQYSKILIESDKKNVIVWDFDELHNIRRIWFENEDDSTGINDFVSNEYRRVAKKYDLNYITD